MATSEPFQRARRPEQKEERRLHLLGTARAALHGGMEVSELGLNELARQAAMTKSNVYRYFENREALLLALLEEEAVHWLAELDARLAAGCAPRGTAQQLAEAFAGATAAHPLMCRLFSVLPSIIEHNVSAERLTEFKRNSVALTAGVAERLQRNAPALPFEAYVAFMRQAIALLIGLWPLSTPGPALKEALSQPELLPMRYDFEADLTAGAAMLLRGLGLK